MNSGWPSQRLSEARRSTAFITLHVARYSTDEEVAGYLKLLHEQGENDLRLALEKVEVGWVKISNALGYPVSIAREFKNPDGTRTIRIVTARQMALFEMLRNTRSADYPFGAMELKMPANGKDGEGRLLAALSIEFTDKGELELENLGTQPLRVMNMRREPDKPRN